MYQFIKPILDNKMFICTMYQFIKPILDNKMFVFEAYGAFNLLPNQDKLHFRNEYLYIILL